MTVSVSKAISVAILGAGIGAVAYLLFDHHLKESFAFSSSRGPHSGGIFDISDLYTETSMKKRGKEDRGPYHVDPHY